MIFAFVSYKKCITINVNLIFVDYLNFTIFFKSMTLKDISLLLCVL